MSSRPSASIAAIIVDDEQLARDELTFLLKEHPDVEVVASAGNGLEAIELIEKLEPDLVFLDVQMPGIDGLGVIRKLREQEVELPYFVLATAFESYAVEAFRMEAFDYVLKPVDKDRLAETIARVQRVVQDKRAVEIGTAPVRQGAPRTKILVKNAGRSFIVDANDIVYATIDDGLITIVTTGHGRGIELPDHRGPAVEPRPRRLLARPPVLPGEHQPHPGSHPLVQVELPDPHGRQETDRNPGQPGPDQAASVVAETIKTLEPRMNANTRE